VQRPAAALGRAFIAPGKLSVWCACVWIRSYNAALRSPSPCTCRVMSLGKV